MGAHAALSEQQAAGRREPVVLLLDESGMIRECSNRSERLFGYKLCELTSLHISKLLPQLSGFELIHDGQFSPQFDYLCHCGRLFEVHKFHGGTFHCELCSVSLSQDGKRILSLFVLPSDSHDSELDFA